MGAPLLPQPVHGRKKGIKEEEPLEVSKARYIVEQYVAAAGGGEAALMYAMGKVRMSTSKAKGRATKKGMGIGGGEVSGGFVVWQKKPELWCVDVVVAGGTRMSAGSDGKGLDPKSTADLFSSAACVGEETVDSEACFVLRVDAEPSALDARSSAGVEVIRHSLWGYFSQRSRLLVRLEDSHMLRIPTPWADGGVDMYWETTMESSICDYRPVDGINIAHAGRTVVTVSRFASSAETVDDAGAPCTCMYMEETWSIEEVDFNIAGLDTECFLPPRDLLLVSSSKEQPRQQKKKTDHGDWRSYRTDDQGARRSASGDKDDAAASCAKLGARDKAAGAGSGIRAAVAKKALAPVVTRLLGWFGRAKVASLDAADESKDST
ncbi:hypothetical protein ACQ4PT_047579 [Festuca glaucescens]